MKDSGWHGKGAGRSEEGLWLARRGSWTVGGRTLAGTARVMDSKRKDSGWHGEGAGQSTDGL